MRVQVHATHPALCRLAADGFSSYILNMAAAQVSFATHYAHAPIDGAEGVYEVSVQAARPEGAGVDCDTNGVDCDDNGVDCDDYGVDCDDYGGSAAVDHGVDLTRGNRVHRTTLTTCSCQYPNRWGCFCRHQAHLYTHLNKWDECVNVMHGVWRLDAVGMERGHDDRGGAGELFRAFAGSVHHTCPSITPDEPRASITPLATRYHTILQFGKQAAHLSTQMSESDYGSMTTTVEQLLASMESMTLRSASRAGTTKWHGSARRPEPAVFVFNPPHNSSRKRRQRDPSLGRGSSGRASLAARVAGACGNDAGRHGNHAPRRVAQGEDSHGGEARIPKPRGRPPKGKVWDGRVGAWVLSDAGGVSSSSACSEFRDIDAFVAWRCQSGPSFTLEALIDEVERRTEGWASYTCPDDVEAAVRMLANRGDINVVPASGQI